MDITLTIPDDQVDALRAISRAVLGNQFPQIKKKRDDGPRFDSEVGGPVSYDYVDDPDVDALKLRLERWVEDEVCAAKLAVCNDAIKAADTKKARQKAVIAHDEAMQAKQAIQAERNNRG